MPIEEGVRNRKGCVNEGNKETGSRQHGHESTVMPLPNLKSGPVTPTVIEEEKYGVLDAFLTVLVRVVLACVWLGVALGWVLERISDVLATIIEHCLAWLHPLQ